MFNILGYVCMLWPPFLLAFAWAAFFERDDPPQAKWRRIVGAMNLCSVSAFFIVCVLKFLGNTCNADAGDWSCVIAWRAFVGWIVRVAPFLLVLAILSARRTRLLTFFSVVAIVFDVILVDMMA